MTLLKVSSNWLPAAIPEDVEIVADKVLLAVEQVMVVGELLIVRVHVAPEISISEGKPIFRTEVLESGCELPNIKR